MSRPRTSSERGRVFVLSGPSGVGKSTVGERLLRRADGLERIVTATTRRRRRDEVDGRDYHFLTREAFEARRDEGGFLEWAEVHGELYGTPRAAVEAALARGHDVLLIIDVQGADQLRATDLDADFIFLLPPSEEALEERIRKRGAESEDAIRRRLGTARREMAEAPRFAHRVVNDSLEEAVEEVSRIVRR